MSVLLYGAPDVERMKWKKSIRRLLYMCQHLLYYVKEGSLCISEYIWPTEFIVEKRAVVSKARKGSIYQMRRKLSQDRRSVLKKRVLNTSSLLNI